MRFRVIWKCAQLDGEKLGVWRKRNSCIPRNWEHPRIWNRAETKVMWALWLLREASWCLSNHCWVEYLWKAPRNLHFSKLLSLFVSSWAYLYIIYAFSFENASDTLQWGHQYLRTARTFSHYCLTPGRVHCSKAEDKLSPVPASTVTLHHTELRS